MATVQPDGQTVEPASRPAAVTSAVRTAMPAQARRPRSSFGPRAAGSAPIRSPAAAVVRSMTMASSTIGTAAASAAPTSTEARAW